MSGTGYQNPVDGKTYPFYQLNFNTDGSPNYNFSLLIKVVTPDFSEGDGGSQTALESYLAQIAEAVAGMSGVESESTYVFRIDASSSVLDSD
jgi:hypothetical protein